MSWYLNGIRIFVQDIPSSQKQIIPRLQPLNGGTIHQVFGYEDPIVKVSAIVVGSGDVADLKALSKTGLTYDLVGPDSGVYGTYYIASVSAKQRLGVIGQTMRPDLDCESPVYDLDIELYEA